MIIDRNLNPYIVYVEDSIQYALEKINKNSKRMVYCLSESGFLEGVVTDGDFRRWVVTVSNINLENKVSEIANKEYVCVEESLPNKDIENLFSSKILSIPLVDSSGRLVSIAWNGESGVRIGHHIIRDDKPAFIIAEIGNNHNGSLKIAKLLIDQADEAGVDCVKFQLRDMKSLYTEGGNAVSEDLGAEYTLDLLQRFQLSVGEMYEALNYARSKGLTALCTPWDVASLKKLVEYGVEGLKIASADLTNHELLRAAARAHLPMLVSTGMSTEKEIRESVEVLREEGASFVLLQCNSTYPAPMQDINLAYMDRLKEIAHVPVGYSGHERGYEVCIAAIARGAKVIEKHFTLDRSMEGNDHRVSLLPGELTAMVKAIRNVEQAIGSSKERQLTQGERLNREVLAKSLIASCTILKGTVITEEMLTVRSPGRGLQPSRAKELIGTKAYRDMQKGDLFYESDILGNCVSPRPYRFNRPWGIPVRYHDIQALTDGASPDFVEIHFSYRDLDLQPSDYFSEPENIGLVVHSPELFSGDHLMDLSSSDANYRDRSILELQRVVNRTRELKKYFLNTEKPLIIINAGGFSSDRFMPKEDREKLYERIGLALAEVDSDGVEIIPQTMPPFPWHFGGQRYHNLFMDPDEIVDFCVKYDMRVCLDTSHSKLACNYFGWSMRDFIRKIGPYSAHLHIVDACGYDDEGLQIGEGDIDFKALGEDLQQWSPNVSFIPEIWQGHKNTGEGFWVALDRLESSFSESH
ncbi:N-acetylneuraminate synthase family protein [Marinobacterium sp. YM272]|uniref:N-acetylneuraminate synthase family protein n=1 Tax=Marinobacterium sp. YM272 TaxID=3421654 RepID=UPI003D7F730C